MNRLERILQVEDSPEDQMMTAEALREVSPFMDLRSVVDTKEAMAILSGTPEWHPNVVLLDLSLPGGSGFEMLQFMKSHPDLRSIPVIIFSSSKAQQDVDKAYRFQANWYVAKPADFEGYLAVMDSMIKFCVDCVQLPFPGHISERRIFPTSGAFDR
jgi:two-component system, chemotaxis family, response regulator Rcp1